MRVLAPLWGFALLTLFAGQLVAATEGGESPHVAHTPPYPDDENGSVFRRMELSGFDFTQLHDVEFFAVLRTEAMADAVAREYLADSRGGEKLQRIDTLPAPRGGMALRLVKRMMVIYEYVTAFELKLAKRVARYDGYLDGWGVLQQ